MESKQNQATMTAFHSFVSSANPTTLRVFTEKCISFAFLGFFLLVKKWSLLYNGGTLIGNTDTTG